MQAVTRKLDHNWGRLQHLPSCSHSEKILLAKDKVEALLPARGTFPTRFGLLQQVPRGPGFRVAVVTFAISTCSFSVAIAFPLISSVSCQWKAFKLHSGGRGEASNKPPLQHGNLSILQGKQAEIRSHAFYQTWLKFSHVVYTPKFPYLFLCSHILTPNVFGNREIKYWLSHIAQQIEPQHNETPQKADCKTENCKSAGSPIFVTVSPILGNCVLSSPACVHGYRFIISKPHRGSAPITQPQLQPVFKHRQVIELMVPFQSLTTAN